MKEDVETKIKRLREIVGDCVVYIYADNKGINIRRVITKQEFYGDDKEEIYSEPLGYVG